MLPTSPLLLPADWNNLFTQTDYEKFKKKDRSLPKSVKSNLEAHSLKYMIALSCSKSGVLNQIQSLQARHSNQIDSSFGMYQFTALHIAVMKGHKEIVGALIEAGANFSAKDSYGWTPLHHAALISNEVANVFRAKIHPDYPERWSRLKEEVNHKNGTPEDLACLSGKAQVHHAVTYRAHGGAVETIQVNELAGLLGIRYVDQCVWPANLLPFLWTSPNRAPERGGYSFHQHQIREQYRLLRDVPAPITIEETAPGVDGDSPPTRHVIARGTLNAFKLLGEYTGDIRQIPKIGGREITYSFVLEDNAASNYTVSVDAEKAGNWTRYMNEGFPNIVPLNLYNAAGQTSRIVFFVADPAGIQDGVPLCYDYTCCYHTLKWGKPYEITGKGAMRLFFQGFEDYLKGLGELFELAQANERQQEAAQDSPYWVQFKALETRLLYPFQTPTALMDLVFSRTINPTEWQNFVREQGILSDSLTGVVNDPSDHYKKWQDLLGQLARFEGNAVAPPQNLQNEIMPGIRTRFLERIEAYSADRMMEVLTGFNNFIESLSPANITTFCVTVEDTLNYFNQQTGINELAAN